MIELRLLGTLDLRSANGHALHTLLAQPKRLALLAYLTVATPHGFHRRDTLLALFWPEADEERARASLRQALHGLRQRLGEGVIGNRGDDEVGIDQSVLWCDAARVDDAIDAGQHAEAVRLYRGDLLPGFFLGEAPDFERWLEGERVRLRTRVARASLSCAEGGAAAASAGVDATAVSMAQRARELAPEDESTTRQVIEVLHRAGDRAGALRTYDEFARRLAADYDAVPSTETRALVERVRAGPTESSLANAVRITPQPALRHDVAEVPDADCTPVDDSRAPTASPARSVDQQLVSRAHRWVIGLYLTAFVLIVVVATLATRLVGLPDWVVPGAVLVMALGLPVVGLTMLAERRFATGGADRRAHPRTPGARHIRMSWEYLGRWFTWRRTVLGGIVALFTFVLLVAADVSLRSLGVGPAGSLVAAGALAERPQVVLTDFGSPSSDTLMGTIVAEALRTDLSQSRSIRVTTPGTIQSGLRRMQADERTRLDLGRTRDLARREGIEAIVDGEVSEIAGSYILTARLIDTETGDVLAAFRETAADQRAIIPATDRLSGRIRARIGESLKSVRNALPLDRVTTSSFEALRKYVEGDRAWLREGDLQRAIALIEEAIAIDTGFAIAYSELATLLDSQGGQLARMQQVMMRAYELRERLPELERYIITGNYYLSGPTYDPLKSAAAYEAAAALQTDDSSPLHQLGVLYSYEYRDFVRSEQYYRRALAVNSNSNTAITYANLALVQMAQGKVAEARSTIAELGERFPNHPRLLDTRYHLAFVTGMYDSVVVYATDFLTARRADPVARSRAALMLHTVALTRGRLAEAEQWRHERVAAESARGALQGALAAELVGVRVKLELQRHPEAARDDLDAILRRYTLDSIPALERPHTQLVALYAMMWQREAARGALARMDSDLVGTAMRRVEAERAGARARLAIAEGRYGDAIAELLRSDRGHCSVCRLPEFADVYDRMGNADSALSAYERYVNTPSQYRAATDAFYLGRALERLGELHEAKGHAAVAARYYRRFADLWSRADPELQPRVNAARRRADRLQSPD